MIAELQVLPSPPGTETDRRAYVDAAIASIAASGLTYEVVSLGTTFEGEPGRVWTTARLAHEAALAAGAAAASAILKLYEGATGDPVSLHGSAAARRARS